MQWLYVSLFNIDYSKVVRCVSFFHVALFSSIFKPSVFPTSPLMKKGARMHMNRTSLNGPYHLCTMASRFSSNMVCLCKGKHISHTRSSRLHENTNIISLSPIIFCWTPSGFRSSTSKSEKVEQEVSVWEVRKLLFALLPDWLQAAMNSAWFAQNDLGGGQALLLPTEGRPRSHTDHTHASPDHLGVLGTVSNKRENLETWWFLQVISFVSCLPQLHAC